MDPLFPTLPDDLSTLSDSDLNDLAAEHRDAVLRIKNGDAEFIGERSGQEVIDAMTAGVEAFEQIKAEQADRETAAETFRSDVEALANRVDLEPTADADGETVEAAEDAEAAEVVAESDAPEVEAVVETAIEEAVPAEPVLASAEKRYPVKAPIAAPDRAPRITVTEPDPFVALVASGGLRGIAEGTPLDRLALANAIMQRRGASVATAPGIRDKVVIASAQSHWDESRTLRVGSEAENMAKIQAVVAEDAIVAAGGVCAPATPRYDFQNISVASRPVRDALPGFMAERGGIRYAPPASIADVDTAITYITEAEDALGGTFATKGCQVVECPDITEVYINIIAKCLQFGNLNGRTWPELVAHWVDLTSAAHARTAEVALLDGIDSGSTALTDEAKYGTTSTLIQGILKAAASIRYRYRMQPGISLRLLIGDWVADNMAADLTNQQFGRFEFTRDDVKRIFSRYNVNATWVMEADSGEEPFDGSQGAGALDEFATTVKWFLFPEGTWLFLDGGTLDLGLVRDSVLNATNDYQLFAETFENVANVGVVSYAVESTVCPSGAVAAPTTAITC